MQSLKSHHSFHFPVFCEQLAVLNSESQAQDWFANTHQCNWLILGEGSNSVFLENFEGIIAKVNIQGITVDETDSHYLLSVGAGENWHKLVVHCQRQGMYGLENLALIPGSVGAAPIQNIGAYGVEVSAFIDSVECLDVTSGDWVTKTARECRFGYRDSRFKHDWRGRLLICRVNFVLPKRWQPVADYGDLAGLNEPSALDIFSKVIDIRQSKLPDPDRIGNAGSFFKNPVISKELFKHIVEHYPDAPHFKVDEDCVKLPAAWLIDRLGFKGTSIGGISCHHSQPLVLTNDGSGTGEQLIKLATSIRDKVWQEFSIKLENEVQLIGKTGPVIL